MRPFLQVTLAATAFAISSPPIARAHTDTVREMAQACASFLQDLDDRKRAKATFDWKDVERVNWHFIPRDRKGLPLKELDDSQRALAHALIVTGLSHEGYRQAMEVMSLEKVLFIKENRNPTRDAGKYYISVFGKPEPKGTWGWRVEGHHLSLNYTVVKGRELSVTPAFFATNPGRVLDGPRKGLQVLAGEENVARKLVNSLSEAQRKKAIFAGKAPSDIITSADRSVKRLEHVGIGYGDLEPEQQKLLQALVNHFLKKQRPAIYKRELARIDAAGWNQITFAWAGGVKKGEGHYYRIQSPDFLMEYANTQNDANHVHAVFRDLKGDFGDDILKRHYEENHP